MLRRSLLKALIVSPLAFLKNDTDEIKPLIPGDPVYWKDWKKKANKQPHIAHILIQAKGRGVVIVSYRSDLNNQKIGYRVEFQGEKSSVSYGMDRDRLIKIGEI